MEDLFLLHSVSLTVEFLETRKNRACSSEEYLFVLYSVSLEVDIFWIENIKEQSK